MPGANSPTRRIRSDAKVVKYAGSFAEADEYLFPKLLDYLEKLNSLAQGTLTAVGRPRVMTAREVSAACKQAGVTPAQWSAVRSAQVREEEFAYAILPDFRALQYLVDRCLYRPTSAPEASLGAARVERLEAEAKAGLPAAQADQLRAVTAFTQEQCATFRKSLVDEELVKDVLLGLQQSAVAYVQKYTVAEFQGMTEAKKQSMLSDFASVLRDRLAQLFGVEDEVAALEAKFENASEED